MTTTANNIRITIVPRGLRPVAAALYLGVAAARIEDLMREGKLPFRMLGDTRVLDIRDLDAYFESIPTQTGRLAGRGIYKK